MAVDGAVGHDAAVRVQAIHELRPRPHSPRRFGERHEQAKFHGRELDLTAVEFKLLSVLASQPGRIFTRDQLMDHMYRDERVVADRTVDSHVKKLRRKIADVVPEEEFIHSVYGVGYCYEDRRD